MTFHDFGFYVHAKRTPEVSTFQKFKNSRKNVLECFNRAGTYRIMIYDLKNHEKSRGPSVSGSKCPRGPSVAPGDTWTLGTLGPRTFRPQDTWTPRLIMVFEVINQSVFLYFHKHSYVVHPKQLSNYNGNTTLPNAAQTTFFAVWGMNIAKSWMVIKMKK